MPNRDARAIANEFISLAQSQGKTFTHMQIQKLVYFANGWFMALEPSADPLVRDDVQAWAWGPVIPAIYDSLKKYGSGPVADLIHENEWKARVEDRGPVVSANLNQDEVSIIGAVYEGYGDMSGGRMSDLTHEDGTPWQQAYKPNVRSLVIPNTKIRDHFRELADASRAN